jgi:hypothetical protein
MKSNKVSKKKQTHVEVENTDFGSKAIKGVKKDRGTKRRLSIYDEFDDNLELNDLDLDDDQY